MADVLVHVVLAMFYQHVPQETRESMREKVTALGTACGGRDAGILCWRAGWNLDQRKGYHLMQFSIFEDEAALQRFRAHPAHMKFVTEMSLIADWVVGDIKVDLPAA